MLFSIAINAQSRFLSINSTYDHSAAEWLIYTLDADNYEKESRLYLKWPLRNDWTHWTIDFEDAFMSIKRQWNLTPQHWELTHENRVISMKQKWRNDLSEWDIHYSGNILKWKTVYPNRLDEWYFEIDEENYFDMWTRYNGDPRDWDIDDRAPNIPDEVKLAAMFITIYLANPRQ